MQLLQVATVEQAREKLSTLFAQIPRRVERVPLTAASGRVCAEDLAADAPIPAFRRSTMDGYAVRALDTAAAGDGTPVFLRLIGQVEMGRGAGLSVGPGECAYVPTGGMMPEGADAMVMVEYCELFGTDGVAAYQAVAPGQHVVQPGEDADTGERLVRKGALLSPQHIGALAAAGIASVPVFAKISLALISTGDELVPPENTPATGQVRDINTHALRALAERNQFSVSCTRVLSDDGDALRALIQDLMPMCEIIAVSGGSSQGNKDVTRQVLDSVSAQGVFLHGLAIKPGKPTILGYDATSQTMLAGLPGHPVSAMMVFELLFSWLARRAFAMPEPVRIPATLSEPVPGAEGKLTCCSVRLIEAGGRYQAVPVHGKSGLITTLTQADGFFTIDRNREGVSAGETVLVQLI